MNYDDSSEITFSGDFHCALFAVTGNRRTSWNLLADKTPAQQHSDWLNRGRMIANQLRDECAGSPYGITRVFRLRSMRLTLRFSDIQWVTGPADDARLKQFTFLASASTDPTARESTAEVVSVPKSVSDLCL